MENSIDRKIERIMKKRELRWHSGNVDISNWILRLSESSGSILVDVKTVQMLFNVVWSFLLTVWMTVMRLCAELITSHINLKPIWNSEKFLREGNIHTTDSCASPWKKKTKELASKNWIIIRYHLTYLLIPFYWTSLTKLRQAKRLINPYANKNILSFSKS
jgi:hypothetical protein